MCIDKLENKIHRLYNNRLNEEWRGTHIMRGRIPDSQSIQLVSNDYLSLANHPEILKAQLDSLSDKERFLLMSAVFLKGDNPQHNLENRFAEFMHTDEAILCQSGYNANLGILQCITEGTNMPVYIDMLAHMSLHDGLKFSDSEARRFRHNDVDHLSTLIERNGPGLVIVDSVYSTLGTVCPLRELVDYAWSKECIILVDESHSLGVYGPQGSGLVVELGLEDKVMFRTASLAKAFAGRAGIVGCPKGFSEFFRITSNSAIFSSALLPHELAGLSKTLDLIITADAGRERLHKLAGHVRTQLTKLGYNLNNSQSQIIGLESGSEWNTILLRDSLETRGVFGSPFCSPATPKNRALIRLSINAGLTDLQVRKIVNVCRDIRDEVNLSEWPSTLRLSRNHRTRAKAS